MLNITIKTIPHSHQRYDTVGDYIMNPANDEIVILVSDMGDWRKEAAVAIHELWEFLRVKRDGVQLREIDKFDIAYEKARRPADNSEPGDAPDAPYKRQHCEATGIERLFIAAMGMDWNEYEQAIYDL